jgi:hypothetical protein
LVESWNGNAWSQIAAPGPGGNDVLEAVSCTTSNSCVAAGGYFGSGTRSKTLIEIGSTPAPPTISTFSPTSGPPGTLVTINGTNLEHVISVTFNVAAATITKDTATKIKVTVPSGATTGKIKVTTPGGTAKSATSFTVT